MLPKEEKQVKDSEVVVRHGGGNLALANSLRICLEEHKKKGVKGGEAAFWGGQTWWPEKLWFGRRRRSVRDRGRKNPVVNTRGKKGVMKKLKNDFSGKKSSKKN